MINSVLKAIIPTQGQSLYTGLDKLSTLEQNIVVRPENPPPGIAGFLFDIVTEDGVELTSDITDHYVEDNSAVQDHIALKPEIITVRGFVGELALTQAQVDNVAKAIDALPLNDILAPKYDDIGQSQIDQLAKAGQTETDAQTNNKTLYQYFDARYASNGTKQSKAFAYFYQLWKGRERFTLDTPWGFFTNVAIQSLRATQGEESKYISDFVLTFKVIRVAQELEFKEGQIAGRAEQQITTPTQTAHLGENEPSQSILYALEHPTP